ncbi:MAG TPA: metal ABC transporter permease [Pseudomonadales bacterium]|nr:metal ABC transporter permease [Pseudomonadales bacterium]
MIDMLSYGFMQRALAAGVLVGVLCGLLSFFVVLRRLSFIGVGISHSAFGGVAIGVLTGFDPLLLAGLVCTLVAWGIGWVSRRGRLHEDTAIGILFSSVMALGIALISLSHDYQVDLFGYLFGNILAVAPRDLVLLATATVAVVVVVGALFRTLLFVAFDEEVARANGLPVDMLQYLLLTSLAVAVVAAMRVVGIILVEALLVIPAAVGVQLTRGYRAMLTVSIAVAIIAAVSGVCLSYVFNVAAGATIILVASVMFFVSLALGRRRQSPARLR